MQPLSMYIAFDADGHWHAVDADTDDATDAVAGLDCDKRTVMVTLVKLQPVIYASGKVTLAIVEN